MRYFLTIFLALFLTLGVYAQDRDKVLKVYNWDDFVDPDLIEEFETWYQERTGEEIHVLYQTYESDFQALNTVELGEDDWDVLTISTAHIAKAMRKGLLKKVDRSVLAETGTEDWMKLISPYFRVLFKEIAPDSTTDMFDYIIPLSVGTTGVIYNTKNYSEEEVNTWNILHDSKFKNQILLVGERDDVFCVASSAVNAKDVSSGKLHVSDLSKKYWHDDVVKVEAWLKEARPQLAGWDTNFGYSYLIQERFPILVSWNSNAISAIRESEEIDGPELKYVIPQEGTYISCDCLIIPKFAANTKAATYWLDFMCKPENVVRNMAASNMISPVADSLIYAEMYDEEKFPKTIDVSYMFPDCPGSKYAHLDPTVYIDYQIIQRSFMVGDIAQNMEELSEMYSRVQSNEPDQLMIAFELLVVLLVVGFSIYSKYTHYQRMKIYRLARENNLSKIKNPH